MSPSEVDAALDRLRERYTFRDPDAVTAYLREFPELIPILFEATTVVPCYFGSGVPLALEIFVDPESEDEIRWLYAVAQVAFSPDEALERMDRLDEEWWLDRSPDGPGVLVLDFEFI
jgi:hypothetical protein